MSDHIPFSSLGDTKFDINDPAAVVPPARGPVMTAIESHDAVGFVAVNTTTGEHSTASFRYLTAISSPFNSAYVYTNSGPTLCVQSETAEQAMRTKYRALNEQIDTDCSNSLTGHDDTTTAGDTQTDHADSDITIPVSQDSNPIGIQAAAVLDSARKTETETECADTRTVLVPATIPHDTAIHLEQAGYTPQSTSAVTSARIEKDATERQAIRIAQSAGLAAVNRIESQLTDMTVTDEQLMLGGKSVTTQQLERIAAVELARRGVGGADCVCVITTESTVSQLSRHISAGTLSSTSTPIQPGVPIQIGICPRGPSGYHGLVWRTIVIESEGGWERRAHIAVEAALETAINRAEPGISLATIYNEALAELAAFGFNPSASDNSTDHSETVDTMIHGVGLSRRERPYIDSEMTLKPGVVLAIAPGIFNVEHGGVRLCDVISIHEDGISIAGNQTDSSDSINRSLTPTADSYSS